MSGTAPSFAAKLLQVLSEATSSTRTRTVPEGLPSDRLAALLDEIGATVLVQRLLLCAGGAEIALVAGRGRLLEVARANLLASDSRSGDDHDDALAQAAGLLLDMARRPEPIAVTARRAEVIRSSDVLGWSPDEIATACEEIAGARYGAARPSANPAEPEMAARHSDDPGRGAALDALCDAVAPMCHAVLRLRLDGVAGRAWGDASELTELAPRVGQALAGWLAASRRVLSASQLLLLRSDNGPSVAVVAEDAGIAVFAFDNLNTGRITAPIQRHLHGGAG